MVGTILGHYRIIHKLGAGGMGEVYRARDARLERDVALKVLAAETLTDESARSRFRKEALALGRLNHPNIGTVHDFDTQHGVDFIVMELVAGESLNDTTRRGPMPEAEVVSIGVQVASALEEAHERGIVHRDLKPGNIIVTARGQAKVLDFGLARLVAHTDELTATETSYHLAGTLAYMSPEQLRGQPADARSDIWALGVVLYEMSAGVRPFTGQTQYEVSSGVLHKEPTPLPPKVPVWLRGVINRCLEKDPARRYQRAGEVRAALEAARTGAVTARWTPRPRGPRALALGVAVVALLSLPPLLNLGGVRTWITGGGPAPRIERLAVLPLDNLSGDASQEYFADGITEMLITDLTKLGVFKRVTARASVARYRKLSKPLAEVAAELKVDAFLMGSVQRSGDRVSITVQLLDPSTEDPLWTNRYESELKDVLRLQNQIVSEIVRELKVRLSPTEEQRLAAARVVNPEAVEALMRAKFHIQKLTPQDYKAAMGYCETAMRIDPANPEAYLCVSSVLGATAHMGFASPQETASRLKEAAMKALDLDPTLKESFVHLGTWSLYQDWDWQASEHYYARAGELPSNARVTRADLYMIRGQHEMALREIRRALDDDPLNSWMQTAVGGRLLRLGKYDEAVPLLQKSLTLDPNMGLTHRYLWTAFHGQRRLDRALEHASTFIATLGHPDVAETMRRVSKSETYARAMGAAAEALAAKSRAGYVQPSEIARLFAYAGDKERAFEWLDRAYDARDTWMAFLNTDPRFDSLHADPRFTALVKRMGME